MSANKVKFGLDEVHYATFTINQNGEYSYDTPVAIPGAVNISLSAEGDSTDFYADNMIYFNSTANQGYSGDLEIAMIPDSFRKDVLGEIEDTNGALIEDASVLAKGFALGFKVKGDKKNRKFWYFNCSASRPGQDAATTEASITPQTDKLTIKAMPRLSDNKVRAVLELTDSNATAFNGFFSDVYTPAIEVSE